jgi:RNA polymerase sigma factor (sigma-70 family)
VLYVSRATNRSAVPESNEPEFSLFVEAAEPRLRRALVAAYGSERGREAAAEALAYAWEHWDSLKALKNPIGYLYRVGQSRSRPRKEPALFVRPENPEPWFESNLASAMETLSESQRVAVVLVHAFGWTLREVAECTGIKVTSVQNHLDRGLRKLRAGMKVNGDVRTH